MIESQVGFAMRQIDRIEAEDLAWLEPRPEVTDAYNDALQKDIDGVGAWQADCFGYYRSSSGRIVTQWPHNMGEYAKRTGNVDPSEFVSEQR
jgi:hypothetical protein